MECPFGYTKYSDGEDTTCEITTNTSYVTKVGKYVVLALLLSLKNNKGVRRSMELFRV